VQVGGAADLLLMDAPLGSEAGDALETLAIGDTPAVAAAIVDGVVRVASSRNTPGSTRKVRIPWMTAGGH
jgi:enamidase